MALFEPWQVLSMCTVDDFGNRKIVGSFIFFIEKTGYFLVSVSLKRCIPLSHQGTAKTNENKALDYFDYNERNRTRVLTKTTWGVIGRPREKVATR